MQHLCAKIESVRYIHVIGIYAVKKERKMVKNIGPNLYSERIAYYKTHMEQS